MVFTADFATIRSFLGYNTHPPITWASTWNKSGQLEGVNTFFRNVAVTLFHIM